MIQGDGQKLRAQGSASVPGPCATFGKADPSEPPFSRV